MKYSQEIQQYVRIALYLVWGALANHGINISEGRKSLIASGIGFVATLAWTIWGSRLTALLERAKASSGVDEIEVKVDPELISPAQINKVTSTGIRAKRSDV